MVESELTRSGDSLRVKKSVSFDKNLEIISVYSPPTTPQDSVAENVTVVPPRGTTTVVDQTHSNSPGRTSFFPSTTHEPANPRYQRKFWGRLAFLPFYGDASPNMDLVLACVWHATMLFST